MYTLPTSRFHPRVSWYRLLPAIILYLAASLARAQGTAEDYRRAAKLGDLTRGKVRGLTMAHAWSPNEQFLVFEQTLPGHATGGWMRVQLPAGKLTPAFDPDRIAAFLQREFKVQVSSSNLPVDGVRVGDMGAVSLLMHPGKTVCVVRSGPEKTLSAIKINEARGFLLALEPPSRERRSRDRGPAVHIVFVNRTEKPAKLFWVDRSKKRKKYADLAPGAVHRQHTFAGHVWVVTDADGKALSVFEAGTQASLAVIDDTPVRAPPKTPPPPVAAPKPPTNWRAPRSPNGRWEAFIRDSNVFLHDTKTRSERPLSADGSGANVYHGPFFWSPDSRHLVVNRTAPAQKHTVYVIESAPKDQIQPKLHSFNYLKPGDKIAVTKPSLFDVAAGKKIPVSDALFPTPWSVSREHWAADSSRFFFLYNQRGHQVMRLISIDTDTGKATTVIDEHSKTFIDYSQKTFLHYLDETGEALWMSERNGWNHLYRIDLLSGRVNNQVTRGKWVVRKVVEVDEARRELLLQVLGIYPGQDPYYTHYARVNFDGTGFTRLTAANGTHDIQFSPEKAYFIDIYSRVDLPPVRELRSSRTGALVAKLSHADATDLLKTGWHAPEPFVAKGRDGKTDIYGVIYRPTTFRPDLRYPVIEAIYAGPHGFFVPKSFAVLRGPQRLAELGFITVQIDGMGTNWRSRAFHDVCWKDLGDAGFPDRIAWMRAAAKRYPAMDLTRVGIYGGSAGGQNAMRALIAHHDFYKVAVADCGCHDNRMDKIWWNEAWMGWPIDKATYDRSSNVVQAHRLEGHLLLTVGELDHNVDPASTMQVVRALIDADKGFDLIVFPGKGHGAGGSPYGVRRRNDFFVRHLWHAGPKRPTAK